MPSAIDIPEGYKVVWEPLPGSQTLALTCPCDEILMAGPRGSGKTDVQIMRFRRHVGQGYGRYWKGIIFDREYKNLDDIVSRCERWFPQFNDGAAWHSSKADYKWTWPTGEELLIRSIKKPGDYSNYHGQEFPFIGWNELTKFPTSELYDRMLSCNRSSFHAPPGSNIPPIPLLVFSTTNPAGVGHSWVKRQWIDPAPPGRPIRTVTNAFDPALQARRDVVKTRVYIFGSYKENKYLPAAYIAGLENTTDENLRRAWLHGDWSVTYGGALDDLWGSHCIVPRFRIPQGWRVDRSMDWGSTHPFSVGWWAEADGSEVILPGGRRWAPVKGSLFRIWEVYGAREIGRNEGIKMSPIDVAKYVKKYDEQLLEAGWIPSPVRPGPADNSIWCVTRTDTETIGKTMSDYGIDWTQSDKSHNARPIGLELFRQRLTNSRSGEGPGIYFMSNCKAAIQTLPNIPRDEDKLDDVDTHSEDHVYDDCRYRILAGSNRGAQSIPIHYPSHAR